MSILHRYLLRQNLLYLAFSLLACVGIYLLVDVFERLDNFLKEGAAVGTIALYFASKVPQIVSQLLPAVFLVALLVQLSLMRREREMTALESGGVSFSRLAVFFLVYALLWSGIQIGFSQVLGVAGEKKSQAIWHGQGEEKDGREQVLTDIWFRQGSYLIHAARIRPKQGRASGLRLYRFSPDFRSIERIIRADRLQVRKHAWDLSSVRISDPARFTATVRPGRVLPIEQQLDAFVSIEKEESPQQMPLWELGRVIRKLEATGSEVSRLVTAWHGKIAYAFSLFIVTLIGLTLVRRWENVFLNVTTGVFLIFLYYSLSVFGESLGEKGALPPWAGAWLGNAVMGAPAAMLLLWQGRPFRRAGAAS
jgi:lipopolysaccharide export system permease protein